MPKYFYRCTDCENEFEIYHSIKECLKYCDQCELETLIRVPSLVFTKVTKQDLKTKVSKYGKNQAAALKIMTEAGWE